MDIYDEQGEPIERIGVPMLYTMTVTREEEITVPAGTFTVRVVDLSGLEFAYALDVGLVVVPGGGFLSAGER